MPPNIDDSAAALGNAADAPDPAAEFNAALNEAIDSPDTPDTAAVVESYDPAPDQGAAEPGDKAPADAAALGDTAAAPAPAGETPQDPWASAPQHLRDAYQALQRDSDLRIRSMAGRHSSLERQLQALQQAGGQQQSGTQSQDAGTDAGQRGNATPAIANDAIRQLREDYPEVAGPLIDLIAAQQTKLDQLMQPVQQLQQQQATAIVTAQEQFLTSQVPDWQAAVVDDRFGGWLEIQPQSLREAFSRNINQIVDGADAALVVSKFKADVGFAAAPTPGSAAPAQPADDRRSRQLASGRDTGANGPAASNTGPDAQDFDGNLNFWLAKAEKQAATR